MASNAMNTANVNQKPLGIAFIAGIASGLAASLLLRSEKGQEITNRVAQDARELQKQIIQKTKKLKTITREGYEEIVDDLMERYAHTRGVAREELEEFKDHLMSQWDDLRNRWSKENA